MPKKFAQTSIEQKREQESRQCAARAPRISGVQCLCAMNACVSTPEKNRWDTPQFLALIRRRPLYLLHFGALAARLGISWCTRYLAIFGACN
jgi:hypothetical protein